MDSNVIANNKKKENRAFIEEWKAVMHYPATCYEYHMLQKMAAFHKSW